MPATCAARDAKRHLGVGRRSQSPETCTEPGGRHRQEQRGYLKLQVPLGLLSEHVLLQLVVLVS